MSLIAKIALKSWKMATVFSAGAAVEPPGEGVSERLPSDRRPLGGGRGGVPEDPAGASGGRTAAGSRRAEEGAVQQASPLLVQGPTNLNMTCENCNRKFC